MAIVEIGEAGFEPVTITLENKRELNLLRSLLGCVVDDTDDNFYHTIYYALMKHRHAHGTALLKLSDEGLSVKQKEI